MLVCTVVGQGKQKRERSAAERLGPRWITLNAVYVASASLWPSMRTRSLRCASSRFCFANSWIAFDYALQNLSTRYRISLSDLWLERFYEGDKLFWSECARPQASWTTKKDDSLGKPFNTSLFDHRKKIAGGIFEPGDRVPLTPKYSLLVRFEFTFFIFFETDTSFS